MKKLWWLLFFLSAWGPAGCPELHAKQKVGFPGGKDGK